MLGSFDATIASIRSPPSTSLTSFTERSCPIASGVSVSGKVTVSFSGSTGAPCGLRLLDERDLDPEDPVLVRGRRLLRLDVGAELHHPSERPVRDLDLLI